MTPTRIEALVSLPVRYRDVFVSREGVWTHRTGPSRRPASSKSIVEEVRRIIACGPIGLDRPAGQLPASRSSRKYGASFHSLGISSRSSERPPLPRPADSWLPSCYSAMDNRIHRGSRSYHWT
jgi:hypothetical protein